MRNKERQVQNIKWWAVSVQRSAKLNWLNANERHKCLYSRSIQVQFPGLKMYESELRINQMILI